MSLASVYLRHGKVLASILREGARSNKKLSLRDLATPSLARRHYCEQSGDGNVLSAQGPLQLFLSQNPFLSLVLKMGKGKSNKDE